MRRVLVHIKSMLNGQNVACMNRHKKHPLNIRRLTLVLLIGNHSALPEAAKCDKDPGLRWAVQFEAESVLGSLECESMLE